MDQLGALLWDNLDSVLLLITAVGSLVAASTGLLLYRARNGSPDIVAKTWEAPPHLLPEGFLRRVRTPSTQEGSSQTPDAELVTRTVGFHQLTKPARWLVYEVRIAKSCHNWLAVPGQETRNAEGGVVIGYALDGEWRDRIRYDPPVSSATVLLHPDAPKHPQLLFRARLGWNYRTKRKVKVIST